MKTYKKIFFLLLLLFIASINFNLILKSLNLVTGGTQGISLIISHITSIKPAYIILIINILMLIISYVLLGRIPTNGIFVATFVYPLFVRLTSFIVLNLNNNAYIFIFVIVAGIISGITNGYILKLGYSPGGINVLVVILKKYFNVRESISIFIINTCIIIFGMIYFGIVKALYSILLVFISSIVINIILYKLKV